MTQVTTRRSVLRLRAGRAARRPDSLAVEEPLRARIGGRVAMTTMRTPGHDYDLVAGWMVGAEVVASDADIVGMRPVVGEDNTVDVVLRSGVPSRRRAPRENAAGVCGNDSVVHVRKSLRWPLHDDDVRIDLGTLAALPQRLRAEQPVADRSGGLHAAGLFTSAGRTVIVREDVRRINAVDKVVGAAVRSARLPLTGHVLQISGRASFELVQKAVAAGIPVLVAVSAPSSLAVELAEECGVTLVGFVRGGGIDVYSRSDRVRFGR